MCINISVCVCVCICFILFKYRLKCTRKMSTHFVRRSYTWNLLEIFTIYFAMCIKFMQYASFYKQILIIIHVQSREQRPEREREREEKVYIITPTTVSTIKSDIYAHVRTHRILYNAYTYSNAHTYIYIRCSNINYNNMCVYSFNFAPTRASNRYPLAVVHGRIAAMRHANINIPYNTSNILPYNIITMNIVAAWYAIDPERTAILFIC